MIFPAMLGARWFRSRKVQSPVAKSLGGIWLLMFIPAMLALLPGHLRWMHVDPDRRIDGTHRRRLPDPLLESGRRIYRLRDDSWRSRFI